MTDQPDARATLGDAALADKLKESRDRIVRELRKQIVGQDDVVELVLTTLLVGGNSIVTGVPGLAKTLLIQSVAQVLDLRFSRIQFTPDLMPSDITGTDLIQEDPDSGQRKMVFAPGPIFANVVLADEINRTPPKTQSALLEAMQEHRVTVSGKTYVLEEPFFVFATQYPIELEGTYPLPEAQLDRFMFNIVIDYLPEEEEIDVVRKTTAIQDVSFTPALTPVLGGAALAGLFALVDAVYLPEAVASYVARLVAASHPDAPSCPEHARRLIRYGGSPRAAIAMAEAGRAAALLAGRPNVDFADIERVARPALAHRLVLDHAARLEGLTARDVVALLLEAVDPVGDALPAGRA